MRKIKVGIIGYRNHAQRIIDIVSKRKDVELAYVYHPTKEVPHPKGTNDINDIYSCDAVMICSPNDTHYKYVVDILKNSTAYIFCEKPPTSNFDDLLGLFLLRKKHKQRVYFNYNYRLGILNRVLHTAKYQNGLGKICFIDIVCSHGLAFKKEYEGSWRATNKHSLIETMAIHYIDILLTNFGEPETHSYSHANAAGKGQAYDMAQIAFRFGGVVASLFVSYASPLVDSVRIIGTNGYLDILGNEVSLYSPRDTFDRNGFFKTPPVKRETIIGCDYNSSLEKSVNYFLLSACQNKGFDTVAFDAGIQTERFVRRLCRGQN